MVRYRVCKTSHGVLRNEELRNVRDALRRLKGWLGKDIQKKREERLWNSWRKWNRVAIGRNKLAQRCFFLIPKNVMSERGRLH